MELQFHMPPHVPLFIFNVNILSSKAERVGSSLCTTILSLVTKR